MLSVVGGYAFDIPAQDIGKARNRYMNYPVADM